MRLFILAAILCATPLPASAVSITLIPDADASLLEVAPSNNIGGFIGMNSGTTQEYFRTRALLHFDLTSLPTNAVILSASLLLEVTREPDEPPNNTTFGLHRMLRAWGEGAKTPVSQPGRGLPASSGECTWNCSFHSTNAWTVPGGAADVDFSSVESSSQFIYGVGDSPYLFDTTPELVADLNLWMQQPATNFGWMLLCNDEASNFTARRFGTRESPGNEPKLTIAYLVPPKLEIATGNAGQIKLSFAAQAGQSYEIQSRTNPAGGSWLTLTNLGVQSVSGTQEVPCDAASPARLYRLKTF